MYVSPPADTARVISVVTPPQAEPISLAEAKWQAQIKHDDDDEWLETLAIPSARERAEHATWRQLITGTFALRLAGFPCERVLELPRPPLQRVTSITYLDHAGATQTFAAANYRVSAPAGPRARRGRIALVTGASWPTTADEIDAVTVLFEAGYGATGAAVPSQLKMAILRDVAGLYEQRETIQLAPGLNEAIELPDGSRFVYQSFKCRPTA